jgi:hypothetical protein
VLTLSPTGKCLFRSGDSAFSFGSPAHADRFLGADLSDEQLLSFNVELDQAWVADLEGEGRILTNFGRYVDPYPLVLAAFAD